MRRRLDVELVRRGLVPSRTRAVDAIDAGRVSSAARSRPRPRARSTRRSRSSSPPSRRAEQYVSRGGTKLAGALDAFGVDVAGRRAVDVGCVDRRLHRLPAPARRRARRRDRRRAGPARVVAAQRRARDGDGAHQRARARAAARSIRRPTSASPTSRSSRCARSRPTCSRSPTPAADFVLLVKPQFEAGRARVGRGGIVRDPVVHAAVLREVVAGLDAPGSGVDALACRRCAAPTATSSSSRTRAGARRRSTTPASTAVVAAAHGAGA